MLTAPFLAGLAFKSLVLAALALGLLRLARRRSPAERSLIAHLGLLAILLLPVASIVLPRWAPLPRCFFPVDIAPSSTSTMPIDPPASAIAAPSLDVITTTGAPAAAPMVAELPTFVELPTIAELVVWLYALPLSLMLAVMALAVLRLFGMRRRAEVLVDSAWLTALAGAQRRMGFKHGTALLVSEELRSPISWGVLRPTILLDPRAVTAVGDAEAIIAHELAHVARLDWAKLLIARLACTLFWFNPLVWLLARESHQLREEAADDTVLLTDIAGPDYAALLVSAARHDNRAALIAAHGVAPAGNSLRRRVVRVLDANIPRGPVRAGWAVFSLAAVFAVAGPLAAFTTPAARTPDRLAPTEIAAAAFAPATLATTHEPPADAGALDLTIAQAAPPKTGGGEADLRMIDPASAEAAPAFHEPARIDPDDVIAAKASGLTPDYLSVMRRLFPHEDLSEFVGARSVVVDPAFAQAMRAADASADLDAIIGARAVGVTIAYLREIRVQFPSVTIDELTDMRAMGITGQDIRDFRAAGFDATTPDDVVSMHAGKSHRAPSAGISNGPAQGSARSGAIAVIGPGGMASMRRTGDGTSALVIHGDPGLRSSQPAR